MAETDKTVQLPPAQFFNLLRVSFSSREFFFDLAQSSTDPGVADLIGRFVTTPAHAKQIGKVLSGLLGRYEEKFGPIPDLEPASDKT